MMTPWEKHEKQQAERQIRETAETILPSKEFDEALFFHAGYMRKEAEKSKSNAIMPRAIVLLDSLKDGRREVVMIATPDMPDTHEGRAQMFGGVGAHFAQQDLRPVAIIMILETWATITRKGEKMPDCRPSENPDRREFLMLAGASLDGRQNTLMLPITRGTDDEIKLGEAEMSCFASAPKVEQDSQPYNFLAAAFFQGFVIRSVIGMGGEYGPKDG